MPSSNAQNPSGTARRTSTLDIRRRTGIVQAMTYPTRRVAITPAMEEELQLLAEFFVLTPKRMAALRKKREDKNDLRTEQGNLANLHQKGFVSRLPFFDLSKERQNGGASYAYGLTKKGMRAYGGKTFDERSARTLDHELAITDFHIGIKKLCEDNHRLLYWQQAAVNKTIWPDAYFSIAIRDSASEPLHFFLEIERQKMGHVQNGVPSIIKKAERYYRYYNTAKCESDWNFKHFRVVFIQKNDVRREHFLRALHKEFNHRMFWLGVDGSPDFRTPKGDTLSFLTV